MKTDGPMMGAAARYLRLMALGVVTAAVLIAVGYVPTMRIGGSEAIPAMLAGCAVSLVASVAGAVPLVTMSSGRASARAQAVLISSALRFIVVLMGTLSLALSGWFERSALLVWVAISYLFLLTVETIYAVRMDSPVNTAEPL